MSALAPSTAPRGLARIYAWPRVRVVLVVSGIFCVLLMPGWDGARYELVVRLLLTGALQLLVFGLFETRPRRLPRWLARWVLQVAGVAAVLPFAMALGYTLTTLGDDLPWVRNSERLQGYAFLTVMGLLLTPWIAMTALHRHVSGRAQRQALAFKLERSRFEHDASQARLRLLQAQVEPHFLFNTLANVRELVESGSPQAATVLGSLIAYLRGAVPRLDAAGSTLAQELDLVRAYLDVMHMRMPDRLQFDVAADDAALAVQIPSMLLLTLVENAVRHGIDPSETGGRIDVRVRLRDGWCRAEVIDTGVGMDAAQPARDGLGTGLATLRERLQLAFGPLARLHLAPNAPHGTRAELDFPARIA